MIGARLPRDDDHYHNPQNLYRNQCGSSLDGIPHQAGIMNRVGPGVPKRFPSRTWGVSELVTTEEICIWSGKPVMVRKEISLKRRRRATPASGRPAVVVLTMVHPNSQREEKIAREVFAAIGIPMAEAIFHRFKVHRDASREGATAQEIEPDSKAAKEIQILWNWVCAELQIGTNANVHKIARR